MTAKPHDQPPPADTPATEGPCNEVLEDIGEALADGIKPDGDPEAALHKLADIVGIYESSDLVEKGEGGGPLDERQRAVADQIKAEKAAAQGLQGPNGDPAEGKP